METETTKRLFTVDELYEMDKAGLFRDQHVELLHGEIFLMSKGMRHQSCVDRVSELFRDAFGKQVLLRGQGPLIIDKYNLPEPDILLLQRRADFYRSEHPRPKDVFLLLEIADSSISHDYDVKRSVYAISGVNEYWIQDVRQDTLLVFRDPGGDTYATQLTLHRGDFVSCLAFPDIRFKVEDILG